MASAAVKARKTAKIKDFSLQQRKSLHALAPWSCVHQDDRSELKAYVLAAGGWVTIASVEQTAHVDAGATANFIASAVNDYERMQNVICELAAALGQCLDCGNLSWEAMRAAGAALNLAQQQDSPVSSMR